MAYTGDPAPASPVRLLLISRVRLYSSALAELLQREPGVEVEAAAIDADIPRLIDATAPHVVLLDCGNPQALGLVARLVRERPLARVLGFGVDEIAAEVAACAAAGLMGCVPASASIRELLTAARVVASGGAVCSARLADGLFRHLRETSLGVIAAPGDPALTLRQRQIVGLIGEGLSNKEIASRLRLGVSTVKNHVHQILARLKLSSRTAAAAYIRRNAHLVIDDEPHRPSLAPRILNPDRSFTA